MGNLDKKGVDFETIYDQSLNKWKRILNIQIDCREGFEIPKFPRFLTIDNVINLSLDKEKRIALYTFFDQEIPSFDSSHIFFSTIQLFNKALSSKTQISGQHNPSNLSNIKSQPHFQ